MVGQAARGPEVVDRRHCGGFSECARCGIIARMRVTGGIGWAWVDGRIVADESATISILDHGFLYGDSVYEAVRTWGGRPFLLQPHLERLERSAGGLFIPFPDGIPGVVEEGPGLAHGRGGAPVAHHPHPRASAPSATPST